MTAKELNKLASGVPSSKKRQAMKYVETLNLDRFYNDLKATASKGHTSTDVFVIGLIQNEYFKADKDFDQEYFLKLFANKLESSIEGLKTSINGEILSLDWTI